MPERGQGDLRAPGFLLLCSLLLGKHRGFATDSDYSGEGSLVREETISEDPRVELTSVTVQGEDDSSSQIPTPSPSPVSESVLSPEFLLMVGVPLVFLLLLFLLVVFLVRYNKRTKSKPVSSSQGSQNALQSYELGSENIKSPIFEEDTPSVMEIEMEDLDKWMNSINRNAESECLPTVREEEKESNHNASDAES